MKETDLAKPVADWLRKQGYIVYSEIPFWSRCIDMVGFKPPNDICVVELKLKFCEKGLRQAYECNLATFNIYLGVNKFPKQKSINKCKKYGIGLLVIGDEITVVSKPTYKQKPILVAIKHLIENLKEPSDNAGLPQMSGCGPAQFVGKLVEDYIKNNPKAGWLEIFNNVPNHYSNHKSLACAMSGYLKCPLYKLREKV